MRLAREGESSCCGCAKRDRFMQLDRIEVCRSNCEQDAVMGKQKAGMRREVVPKKNEQDAAGI